MSIFFLFQKFAAVLSAKCFQFFHHNPLSCLVSYVTSYISVSGQLTLVQMNVVPIMCHIITWTHVDQDVWCHMVPVVPLCPVSQYSKIDLEVYLEYMFITSWHSRNVPGQGMWGVSRLRSTFWGLGRAGAADWADHSDKIVIGASPIIPVMARGVFIPSLGVNWRLECQSCVVQLI